MAQGLFTGLTTLDVACLGLLALAVIAAAASLTIFLVSATWSPGGYRRDRQRLSEPETRHAGRPQSRGL
jgi:hypothetical protein